MTQKELLERIEYIEDKDITINPKWYYHASHFHQDVYIDILTHGIKATVLREDEAAGRTNGRYYVCLARNLNKGKESFFNRQ